MVNSNAKTCEQTGHASTISTNNRTVGLGAILGCAGCAETASDEPSLSRPNAALARIP